MKQLSVLLFSFVCFLSWPTSTFAAPIVPGSFSTTWDTSALNAVSINLGVCPTAVYWEEIGNDTNSGSSFSCSGADVTVTFPTPGQYRIDYSGNFTTIVFIEWLNPTNINRTLFRSVEQWGDSAWTSLSGAFQNVDNLTFNATDVPNLSQTTVTSVMFWDATNFNSDISNWDMSNVTDAWGMFWEASAFNQPIGNWNVSNNQRFWRMFRDATSFNQPLNNWNVSAGREFSEMFQNATAFNQPLNNWDTSSAEYMDYMFTEATSFNQSVANFNFSSLADGGILRGFFQNATAFNQPLNSWDVSGVNNFYSMFAGTTAFNQPLNNWNMASATDISGMFSGASSFNQPLDSWNVSQAASMDNLFDNSGLSAGNYSAILNAWAALPSLQNNVTLGAAGIIPPDTATTARQFLIDTYNWTINDEGLYVEPGSQTFITRWDTRLDPLTENSLSIYTPGSASAFTIDWGDGSTQYFGGGQDRYRIHTYSTPGIKTVTITGNFPSFYAGCGDGDEYNKLIDVVQWGAIQWEYLDFSNCTHLVDFSASDTPNLSQMTHMDMMFRDATAFNGNINDWDVSNITSMWFLFNGASSFNQPLDNWDVSNVTQISRMFQGATAFNQPLNNWDVSSATDFGLMFTDSSFNQPLNNWNVANADRLYGMFADTPFDQDISSWNVSNVIYMSEDENFSSLGIFDNSNISTSNYSKILASWSQQVVQPNLFFNNVGPTGSRTPYCAVVQSSRDTLTITNGWNIVDGGPVACQTVTYSAGENGALTGDTFQYIADGESGTPVTAVPAAGYRFARWSDGSTANPRTDGNLTGALTISAVFAAEGGGSESTKVGERAKQLTEIIETIPVVGSIAKFATSVRDFLTYLTNNEDQLENLTTDERTTIIVALRDILAFLLRLVPIV